MRSTRPASQPRQKKLTPPPHRRRSCPGKPLPFIQKAAAGLIGGALAVCIGTPFDVTLVRMQADTMKSEVPYDRTLTDST